MRPEELILVSVDDHIAEPADMFNAHVPERYRDRAPRVVTDERGFQQWWYGEIKGRNLGLNAVAGKPPEMFNVNPQRYEEMRPGCYQVDERVRDMSAGGQLAGPNFPNWTGFSGQVLNQGPDPDLNEVMIKAYNDWHVDEWCGAYPDRFIPCGILALFDVERAAAEVRRLAGKGCHAVTFSENPAALRMPSLHTDYWDPLFAACSNEGTVLCLHVGSSSRSAATSDDAPPSVALSLSSSMSIYSLGDLMWADFWWRFPDLRFSLTEGDIGWIPYFLQRAEHVQRRHAGWTRHTFPEGLGPAEIFRRGVICCFIDDRVGVKLIDEFNINNVCWESDYPHSDSTWPNAPEVLDELFAPLDDDQINKITHENAMRHFQFDPYAIRSPERCTVAALRAEANDVDTVTRVGRAPDESDRDYFQQLRVPPAWSRSDREGFEISDRGEVSPGRGGTAWCPLLAMATRTGAPRCRAEASIGRGDGDSAGVIRARGSVAANAAPGAGSVRPREPPSGVRGRGSCPSSTGTSRSCPMSVCVHVRAGAVVHGTNAEPSSVALRNAMRSGS